MRWTLVAVIAAVLCSSTHAVVCTTAALNIRSGPSTSNSVVWTASNGARFDRVGPTSGAWVKVRALDGSRQGSEGWAHSSYLKNCGADFVCTTDALNIRDGATTSSRILWTTSRGEKLEKLGQRNGVWEMVKGTVGSNAGTNGWAHSNWLTACSGNPPTGITMPDRGSNNDPSMKPSRQIPLGGLSGLRRRMAEIHNSYGKYLQSESSRLGISEAAAAAVVYVESGGRGFASDGLMIIRFENHVFKRYLGNNNLYNQHFKHDSSQSWKGHYFRPTSSSPWEKMHTSQSMEWRVIQFAQGLQDTAALNSASYGAPQIMGFNSQSIGYSSVQDMFKEFSGSLKSQFSGMFRFIEKRSACIGGLRSRDWRRFASCYNGSGQADHYGGKIGEAVNAYNAVA